MADKNLMNILLVDLQHSPNGSLSDDVNTIKNIFLHNHNVDHLCLPDGDSFLNLMAFYKKILTTRYDRVVILSAKITQLVLIVPATLFQKISFIYHFMPQHRACYHSFMLGILQFFFRIGVYGIGVKKIVDETIGKKKSFLVPSRVIDKSNSITLLKEKLNLSHAKVFIPGIREGVRHLPDLPRLIDFIETKMGYRVEKVIIQTNNSLPQNWSNFPIKIVNFLDSKQYTKIYTESLFVICEFEKKYEVRASGILLDALSYGCIILGNNHPINDQYSCTNSLVTSTTHAMESILQLKKLSIDETKLPPNSAEEGKALWDIFLH
ncbi:hypothetical protein LQR31_16880 [Chromobacterium vaccinii]|uniref:hypothetical protein n=1 Tax=Chromobacterium vaccinii TaxID=1108595 RepID=UPI001E641D18|nr:hypothetical protein [Chromobacterium vaccinii]MCD4486148.1 hypothetical protein [Chromobacterium vaccinii]